MAETSSTAFRNTGMLYLMHFFFAFVSRMWDMGIVLLIAELTNNSLFLVAVTGLISSLAIFLFMSRIGDWLDQQNRFFAMKMALLTKFISVAVTYISCAYLSVASNAAELNTTQRVLLYLLPIFASVAALAFNTVTQSVEKDWIVVLSNGDRNWLFSVNSFTKQIDLGCKTIAPAVTGILFAYLTHSEVAVILLIINAVACLCMFSYMRLLYNSWPPLGQKPGIDVPQLASIGTKATETSTPAALAPYQYYQIDDDSEEGFVDSDTEDVQHSPISFVRLSTGVGANGKNTKEDVELNYGRSGWEYTLSVIRHRCLSTGAVDFMRSGCAGVMIAYSLLFLTVLSFGSVMTVYVRWAGITDDWVGIYRGISAIFGFVGAALFPYTAAKIGLYESTQLAIIYQFILVALAALSFLFESGTVTVYLIIFTVLFSRTGLWLFDLGARQIAQETIPEQVRGKVNGQWRALVAFFDMLSYTLAVIVSDPTDFWILTTVSAIFVGLALITYTVNNPHGCGISFNCNRDNDMIISESINNHTRLNILTSNRKSNDGVEMAPIHTSEQHPQYRSYQ